MTHERGAKGGVEPRVQVVFAWLFWVAKSYAIALRADKLVLLVEFKFGVYPVYGGELGWLGEGCSRRISAGFESYLNFKYGQWIA